MKQLLKRMALRLSRSLGSRHVQAESQELLAAKTRELEELRQAKAQELQAVWDHAHALDRALQRLDASVRAGASGGSPAASPGEDQRSVYEALAHSLGSRSPTVPSVIVEDISPTEKDVRIAGRLLRAYHRAAREESRRCSAPTGDSWAWIKSLQATFFHALERKDPGYLAGYLCNMCRHDATIGTDQGNMEYDKLQSDPSSPDLCGLRYKDKLVSLAEAVGAIPCENPEQGPWGHSLHEDVDVLVSGIERVLGLDISPPAIDGGLLKILSSRALFGERDCHAIFTAWSIRQILESLEGTSLCEIGAGSGRAAYWSHRLGCPSYTIFDLPHVNVVQGYYLLASLPEDRVALYGECSPSQSRNGTTILPYFCTEEIPSRAFDLVLNQDSFPEIQSVVVRDYLAWIKHVSRRYFYSLNHESKPVTIGGGTFQLSVPELVAEAGGYRRVSRTPYWLRRGYVAELYAVGDVRD